MFIAANFVGIIHKLLILIINIFNDSPVPTLIINLKFISKGIETSKKKYINSAK